MIYSNPEFLFLLLPTVLLFRFLPSYRARFFLLTAASIAFYSWAGVEDSLIFLLVILGSWFASRCASRFPKKRALCLNIGISLMLAHLFFWKYASWLLRQVFLFYPNFLSGKTFNLPLPVGISFFTLQGIAYLVDLKRNEVAPIKLREYFLFKSFFPQLVAGPIVRVAQLLPQLQELRRPDIEDLSYGIGLFCLGFLKKMLLADRVAPFVDSVFTHPGQSTRSALLLSALGYTVQIWADFSGYTDMGRGAARMLGIRLPENFLSPYLSGSPAEFWKRWHITLSQWIRDYLYIPLGGNRGSQVKTALVAVVTMAIAGLWHGANWTFVIWGVFHGVLLVGHRLGKKVSPVKMTLPLSWAITQSLVVLGWVCFRAPDLTTLRQFLFSLAAGTGATFPSSGAPNVLLAVLACAMIQIVGYRELRQGQYPVLRRLQTITANLESAIHRPVWLTNAAGALSGAILAALFFGSLFFRMASQSTPFIYFQF